MGLFSFAESPQLQALLADIAPPSIRDASFAVYFTLAFGVGSLWVAGYGVIIDGLGERDRHARSCSRLMAVTFLLAAVGDAADPDRAARLTPVIAALGCDSPRSSATNRVRRIQAADAPRGVRPASAGPDHARIDGAACGPTTGLARASHA